MIDEVIQELKNEEIEGVNLYSTDLENDWKLFLKNFDVIKAAGGLVINPNKKVLFIYRNNVWDLPKGHIEKNESTESAAVREVEEECGIENSTIIQKLIITFEKLFLF